MLAQLFLYGKASALCSGWKNRLILLSVLLRWRLGLSCSRGIIFADENYFQNNVNNCCFFLTLQYNGNCSTAVPLYNLQLKEPQMKNVIEMTTKEMIAEYNTLTGKNITKFSTRAVGEKQLERARAYYGAQEQAAEEVAAEEVAADTFDAPEEIWAAKKEYHYSEDGCPNCGAKEDITPAGEENTAAGERLFCHN